MVVCVGYLLFVSVVLVVELVCYLVVLLLFGMLIC